MNEKRIEIITCKANELKHGFDNPRKITKKKQDELKKSIEESGDFGIFVIDENYNVIGGNQRSKIIQTYWPDMEVTCKMLIGYSVQEKKAINIKDNTHSGEWDLELLAEWTSDLNIALELNDNELSSAKNQYSENDVKLIPYQSRHFVIIATRTEQDSDEIRQLFNLSGKHTVIGDKIHKTIPCRTIWYEDAKDALDNLIGGGNK